MNLRQRISIVCAVLTVTSFGSIASSQIVPDDRRIQWAPGVPGGTPEYPVQYNVVTDFHAARNGTADDTSAITKALAAATPGHAVYLPEGTYRISSTLSVPEGVVVRGAGPTLTTVYSKQERSAFEIAGREPVSATTLSAKADKDADTLQVASASRLTAGSLIQLSRPDDVSQIVEVAAVNGSEVTLSGVLYSDFPEGSAVALHHMISGAGVEDLKIVMDWPALDGYEDADKVTMTYATRSWVKNVETQGYCGHEVLLANTFRCEVRDSYFHHDLQDALAKNEFMAYGVEVREGTSDSLVENNIFNIYRHAMVIQYDNAGGNVFGYNMSWNSYTLDDQTGKTERSCVIGDIEFHHQQVEQTLIEGNHAEFIRVTEGSADYDKSNNTMLRNRITQSGITTGEGNNFVGNEMPKRKYAPLTTDWAPDNEIRVEPDTIAHGNYVVFGGQGLQWDRTIADHEIPASYYLKEKPEWFCDLAWPAFGGDLMPNNQRRSPAEVRFWSIQFPEEKPSDLALEIQGDEVHLAWTANSSNDVDFIVVRGTKDGGFERIAETGDTSYIDGDFTADETRWYYVRARNHLGGENGNELGGESGPSNMVCTDPTLEVGDAPDCATSPLPSDKEDIDTDTGSDTDISTGGSDDNPDTGSEADTATHSDTETVSQGSDDDSDTGSDTEVVIPETDRDTDISSDGKETDGDTESEDAVDTTDDSESTTDSKTAQPGSDDTEDSTDADSLVDGGNDALSVHGSAGCSCNAAGEKSEVGPVAVLLLSIRALL